MVPKIGEIERPDSVFAPEPDYVISDEERDILSYVRASPKGVPASGLNQPQFDSLAALVGAFVRRLPDEVAGAQLHDLERMGMDTLTFAWAGGTSPGDGYRARRCSSSTTTRRETAPTSIRRGGTRRTISATTCWRRTTGRTTPSGFGPGSSAT
jgi:hypothetical protein